ncbi:MAG: hypothetical protein HQM14_18410 [SAR324 cluster bacterium]|nr:hypothetical protein [SAR324 cluster bacterium]
MPNYPSSLTTLEALQEEVSRLLQQIIPVLDAVHTLPFHSEWPSQSPAKFYLQCLSQAEKFLLYCWKRLQQNHNDHLHIEILSWDGEQMRDSESVLQQYYQFYEALGNWAQQQSINFFAGDGIWEDYIVFVSCHENNVLRRCSRSGLAPQQDELELLAQHYLMQMQLVSELDLYSFCVDLFTLVGAFTRKSYFIPFFTFSAPSESPGEVGIYCKKFYELIKNSTTWPDLTQEYLQFLMQLETKQSSD